jgi:hypothetical protein
MFTFAKFLRPLSPVFLLGMPTSPFEKWSLVFMELQILNVELQSLGYGETPLLGLANFMRLIAPWYDRTLSDVVKSFVEKTDERSIKTVEILTALDVHFKTIGCFLTDLNRTKSEIITLRTVFLGDTFGLPRKQVEHWLAQRAVPKGQEWIDTPFQNNQYIRVRNSYDVISDLARSFMTIRINTMRRLLDRLNELVHEPGTA